MSEQKQVGADGFFDWYGKRYPIYAESLAKGAEQVPGQDDDEEEKSSFFDRQILLSDSLRHRSFHQETWHAALASQPEPPSAELRRAAKAALEWILGTDYGHTYPRPVAQLRAALTRAEAAGPVRTREDLTLAAQEIRDAVAVNAAPMTADFALTEMFLKGDMISLDAFLVRKLLRALLPEGEKA